MKITNLDGSSRHFPQDDLISFDEPSHTYTVRGLDAVIPVTAVVKRFFKPFDADYWSNRKCPGDPAGAARLRETWAAKGAVASQAGTHLHKQIERFLGGDRQPENRCRTTYEGRYVRVDREVDISCEWQHFVCFDRATEYSPFRAEWCIFDPDACMAGTVDLLCSRPDGTFEIYDWKRSNKINPDEVNPWASGLNGLEHLTDTTFTHYCLQQNLYRHILERHYGLAVSRMTLVVLHPDLPTFRAIDVPRMEREVEIITGRVKRDTKTDNRS